MTIKTTTSALALTALLALSAHAQTTDGNTAAEQAGDALEQAGDAATTATENAGDALQRTGEAAAQAGEAAVEEASEAANDAGAALEGAAEETGEAVGNATEAAGEAAGDAAQAVEDTGEAVVEETNEAADTATETGTTTETETTTETVPVTTPAEGEATEEVEVTEEVEAPEGDMAEPAEGTPVEGQLFEQSADSFLASTLLGTSVESVDGEGIGDVEDMVLGSDGSIEGVVIGVGGFIGLGEKDVAVQFDAIQVQQDPETGEFTFVLNSTEEELEAAPEFRTQDEIRAEEAAQQPVAPNGGLADPAAPADPNAAPATAN